jgi:hypothetical protein
LIDWIITSTRDDKDPATMEFGGRLTEEKGHLDLDVVIPHDRKLRDKPGIVQDLATELGGSVPTL